MLAWQKKAGLAFGALDTMTTICFQDLGPLPPASSQLTVLSVCHPLDFLLMLISV